MRKERASQLREANECSLKHRITSMLEAGAFFYLYAIEQAATHFLVQLLFTLEVLLLSKTKKEKQEKGKKKAAVATAMNENDEQLQPYRHPLTEHQHTQRITIV